MYGKLWVEILAFDKLYSVDKWLNIQGAWCLTPNYFQTNKNPRTKRNCEVYKKINPIIKMKVKEKFLTLNSPARKENLLISNETFNV